MDVKLWLRQQGLSVRELAAGLGLPVKTVQDWVYRGAMPSPANRVSLEDFVRLMCAHHWVIESPDGPVSRGVCKLCGQVRGFANSIEWRVPTRGAGRVSVDVGLTSPPGPTAP